MERNYIRITSLSFHSMEIYLLFFLAVCCIYILFQVKKPTSVKLIYMYILALPYTDIVYRVFQMQVSEMMIILLVIWDMVHHGVKLPAKAPIKFMLLFSLLLWMSTGMSFVQDIYGNNVYGNEISAGYSLLNQIKFMLIIYMAGRVILEIRRPEELFSVISVIRFSGNVDAAVTMLQVILYKLGFIVPGIFEMWGIPRAKGLSHEPATNAFVLLTTITVSTIYCEKGRYKIFWKSLLLQMSAFLICFSSGAFVIFIAWGVLFLFFSLCRSGLKQNTVYGIVAGVCVSALIGFLIVQQPVVSDAFMNVVMKVKALYMDYVNGTNISGRGLDMPVVLSVLENDPLFGIGAFNVVAIFKDTGASISNMYLVLFAELGMVGCTALLFLLMAFCIRSVPYAKKTAKIPFSTNLLSYEMAAFFMIAWLRVLFFHQIWLVLAIYWAMLPNASASVLTEDQAGHV